MHLYPLRSLTLLVAGVTLFAGSTIAATAQQRSQVGDFRWETGHPVGVAGVGIGSPVTSHADLVQGQGQPSAGEPTPTPAWRFDSGAPILAAPVVANGTVYVVNKDGVHAVDQVTGASKWVFPPSTEGAERTAFFVRSPIAVVDGTLYFVETQMGRLFAVDAVTGTERWRRQTTISGDYFPLPTVVDSVVYVDDISGGSANPSDPACLRPGSEGVSCFGNVYALDAVTGAELWSVQTGRMRGDPLPVADGAVYVADVDGDLRSIDATTGTERWRRPIGRRMVDAPVPSGGAVYVASTDGYLWAVDAATGELNWQVSWESPPRCPSAPQIWSATGGLVHVTQFGPSAVYALDAATGETRWELEPARFEPSVPVVVPVVAGGAVYLVNDAGLHAFDAATGVQRWTAPMAGAYASPLEADGILYLTGNDGSLYAIDAGTGEVRWHVTVGDGAQPSVTSAGELYVGSIDHFLYAFRTNASGSFSPGGSAEAFLAADARPVRQKNLPVVGTGERAITGPSIATTLDSGNSVLLPAAMYYATQVADPVPLALLVGEDETPLNCDSPSCAGRCF